MMTKRVPIRRAAQAVVLWGLVTGLVAVEATARPRTPAAQLERAESLERLGRFKAAAKRFGVLASEVESRGDAAQFTFRQAECLFRAGELHDAYEVYEELLEKHPLHAPFADILQRLRDLAERFARGEGTFLAVRNRALAADIYEGILERAPTGQRAAGDTLRLAELQTAMGTPDDAVFTYRQLLKAFPRAKEVADARLALGRLLLEVSGRGDGDGTLARQARSQLEAFIRHNPKHERRGEADLLLAIISERQARSLYELGEFYQRDAHRRAPASRKYLHDVLHEYPDTTYAVLARLLLEQVDQSEEEAPAPLVARPKASGPKAPRSRTVLPRPEDMTPERRSAPKTYKPLGESQNPKKWLVPLSDLNQPVTGDDAK
ncbi:MAG: tetratricopeptide repeat protein [Lentisphaerae bacterium]|jgi:tetratricopeptide (TPR) repeat protein|nr:tetratricopeptide repeat protein [Lentisphaerota bacterium]MBT4821322.1 tetratricopeptide repeat protein [Lentisphaerota bacterium]MBT5610444.1 tetratricopeptide repeat protein [Lentisphaerota bacterium]MBT7061035.1 tetratricopeptide repeat protein [Lentisphaerota bacterium]MBT7842180.1 tetratricopeptide repeat protein [Lentisphaerota bacterium]